MVDIVKQMRYLNLAIEYMLDSKVRHEMKAKSTYIEINPDLPFGQDAFLSAGLSDYLRDLSHEEALDEVKKEKKPTNLPKHVGRQRIHPNIVFEVNEVSIGAS